MTGYYYWTRTFLPPGWTHETEDESVGIFGEAFFHDCANNEESFAEIIDTGHLSLGSGANRTVTHYEIVQCPVCRMRITVESSYSDPDYE